MRIANLAWVLGCVMCVMASALGADAGRGRLLYEARCTVCHGTSVHLRETRKARSFEGVRAQVERWNAELGGAWSADDIDDVTMYVNNRYYFFPCPDSACGSEQASTRRNSKQSRIDRQ